MSDANPPSSPRQARLFKNPADAWEERTQLVKREVEAERIALEKKTARLKALRLEKEEADRAVAAAQPPAETRRRKTGRAPD